MADKTVGVSQLAKDRMIWALKPILGVCIVVWVVHPATATTVDLGTAKLSGFLAGSIYGLIVFRSTLRKFLDKTVQKTEQYNRFPDEYYMGHIEKVLRSKQEKEI